ncbi:hypothetical protein EK904_013079, partial [Melospiza melodia maxima]
MEMKGWWLVGVVGLPSAGDESKVPAQQVPARQPEPCSAAQGLILVFPARYHLKDVIVGKIYFLLVRIKIKHMEIDIIKRETTGTGPNVYHENDTIAKYEIMDGAPVRGESIPIRLFLAGYELTPTMRDINKKFSVRYYLNLVLIDEEERRYFKQQ